MGLFRKSTAWAVLVCLVLSLVLTVMPVTAQDAQSAEDAYVYYWKPASESVPEYYERYARPYMLYSGHNVHHKGMDDGGIFQVRFFNVVNMEELIADESAAPSGGYATTGAFCADAETYIVDGTAYRRMNLEDGYFNTNPDTLEGTVDARKIRAVLRHSMPNLEDLPAFTQKINAYLTDTYGADAVLVKDLSGSEVISATQSAIWHYANGFDFGDPYPYRSSDNFASWSELTIAATALKISYPDYPSSYVDHADDATAPNINGVYQYLLSLPGEDPKDVVLTDDAVSLADAAISGSGEDCSVTLFINIDGTINGDDDVTLSVKCGEKIQRFSLGRVNTLEKQPDGLYAVTFEGVSLEDCAAVELDLSGEQIIDDVCFFEAKPTEETDGRKTSQNLAGYGHGVAPVYSHSTASALEDVSLLELTKVDERTGEPLSGVAFDLYKKQDGEDLKLDSYVTDAQGKVGIYVTDPEDYYYVETEALEGYEPVAGNIAPGTVSNDWSTGTLELSKKLINTTPAQVGETFDFELTLDLSTAPVMGNGLSWMTGQYIAGQLECSKELNLTANGTTLTASFTLNADETITVDGIPLGATYILEEVMTDEERQWFTVTNQIEGVSAQGSSRASGTVAERNAIVFTNAVVTSQLSYGTLEVSKKLVNTTPAQVGETFDFEITLDFADVDRDAPWVDEAYLLSQVQSSEELTWVQKNGKYTAAFTVDAGETVTFEGIALGAAYQVQEILTAEERRWFNVTGQIGSREAVETDTLSGTVAEQNTLEFTNSVVTGEVKLGDLDISKKLINTTPAQVGETFHFCITLDFSTADIYAKDIPWMDDAYLMDLVSATEELTWTVVNGKYTAEFTLDAGETIGFEGIARGVTYSIQEILTEEDRAWFESTAQIGDGEAVEGSVAQSIIAQQNAVVFTNSVVTGPVLTTGSVEVTKKLINTTPAQVGETFNFRITLDLSTADVYTNAAPWMNDEYLMSFVTRDLTWVEEDGKYTAEFTVNADETFCIDGIAQGTTYTVQEVLTEEDREWFNVTSRIGENEAEASESVESTVAQKNAVVFTNSVVTGILLKTGTLSVGKELEDAPAALREQTFEFRITVDLSQADVYQDPAPWMNDEYLLEQITSSQPLTWINIGEKTYTATFTLKPGQMVELDGVPQGSDFWIQEQLSVVGRQTYRVTTSVSNNGGNAVQEQSTEASGNMSESSNVIFINKYVAPIPTTDDRSLTVPMVLCLLSVMAAGWLVLNKRRFVGA